MKEIQRCPFLLGRGRQDIPSSKKDSDARFDYRCELSGFLFNVLSDFLAERDCLDGGYSSCPFYARRLLDLSIKLPIVCPRNEGDKCAESGEECDLGYIFPDEMEDYRSCRIFSEWFWKEQKKTCETTTPK